VQGARSPVPVVPAASLPVTGPGGGPLTGVTQRSPRGPFNPGGRRADRAPAGPYDPPGYDVRPYDGTHPRVDDAVMVSPTTGDTASPSPPDADPAPFVVEPVDIGHIVVPLDGSPFAERALPVAQWVAAALGADVHLLEVVASGDDEGAEGAIRYLDSVCRRHHAATWDVVQRSDVAEALADAVTGSPGRLACLATHGRGRSATIGSVAVSLLDRSSAPVLLVGPEARSVTATDAPVVVAVDRTAHDRAVVPVALGWAARLARQLDIVTVAGRAQPRRSETGEQEHSSSAGEPQGYLESLAVRTQGSGVPAVARVVRDAVSVRAGLASLLDRTAALVVLGSRQQEGLGRMAPPSCSAGIVHDAAVPALVVPLRPGT
jgi:nucleotide-binding universal stress UspA family protein